MLEAALPIFFLMLGAAVLGFLICWALIRARIEQTRGEIIRLERVAANYETEQQNLITHANSLQAHQKKMINAQQESAQTIDTLETNVAHLKHEKESLVDEFRNYQKVAKENTYQNSEHIDQLSAMQRHLTIKGEELLEWQNKYQALLDVKKEKEAIIKQLNIERKDLANKVSTSNKKSKDFPTSEKKKKWETKYKSLNLKYLELIKEKDELTKKVQKSDKKNTPLKVEETPLDKLKDSFREWNPKSTLDPSIQGSDTEMGILNEIFQNRHRVNFDRIGMSDIKEKNDLKQIKEIGPFAEKKLNAIGIYNFKQISRFKKEDIEKINKIIQLDPEDAITEAWIDQAKRLK